MSHDQQADDHYGQDREADAQTSAES